jgi:hypothetical protein
MDFLEAVVNDQSPAAGGDPTWFITFSDGEGRKGKLAHLSGNAWVLSGKETYYFSSAHVVRINVSAFP